MASPKLLRGGARGWVFRPLPFTCRTAGCFQLRPPLTRPQMWVRITKDKKQIRTLFVLLDQRSGWRNGSSAHTCKTREQPPLEEETLGCLTARALPHPFWGAGGADTSHLVPPANIYEFTSESGIKNTENGQNRGRQKHLFHSRHSRAAERSS